MASPQVAPSAPAPIVDRGTRAFIDTHPDPVRQDSSLYLHQHSTKDIKEQASHVLAGVHVVLKKDHENKLFERFNVDRNTNKQNPLDDRIKVKSLVVACDTLEIHGELSLPECDVKVYARRLVFKDNGAINTSPLEWDKPKAQNAEESKDKKGASGAHGRKAGDIAVFVDEMTAPVAESRKRFIARGGFGQHAGEGKNGQPGESMSPIYELKSDMKDWPLHTYAHATFDPPAVFVEYRWWLSLIATSDTQQRGKNGWPTDGTDALPPGAPGNAGDGGAFTSNRKALASEFDNAGGSAGTPAKNVTGGGAGTPVKCAHYKLKLWEHVSGKAPIDYEKEERQTKAGKSHDAPAADAKKLVGKTPAATIVDSANGWLHPLQLQAVLSYARDAFLSGQRAEVSQILEKYVSALEKERPSKQATGVWDEDNEAQWAAAQSEAVTLLQRLRLQLDYFGNPAGYTPQLSLQSTMRLYDVESKTALRVLLLAHWVADTSNAKLEAGKAFAETIDSLNQESKKVVEEMSKAEALVTRVNKKVEFVESRLWELTADLETLQTKLLNQASDDLQRKALIKAAVTMAGAILQVIPVGQPVLGTIGKLAGIAAEVEKEGWGKSVSKMGGALKKAKDAGGESDKASKKAKTEAATADPANKEAAKKKSSGWATVGKGLGPALSQAGTAISALQVPQEEIDAQLEALKAKSDDWKKMAKDLEEFSEQKADLYAELTDALQAIGDGYSRLAENAQSVFTLYQQSNATLATVDPQATLAVKQFAQRARIALIHSLYLMVKAYETTVFKPVNVNWQLTAVFKKITELLKPGKGFTATELKAYVEDLEPIFQGNLDAVKRQLLKDYDFPNADSEDLEFGFTLEQTPEQLEALNTRGELTLSPLDYGLILPHRHRVRIVTFDLKSLEFASGPALPESGNLTLTLRVSSDGNVRLGEYLYAVRSDAPIYWSWTYTFSDKKMTNKKTSINSLDLLNSILGSTDQILKNKLANPPAWSDFVLRLDFPQTLKERPKIKKLMFNMTCDYLPAPEDLKVLDVRPEGANAAIKCAPEDLAKRGDGSGALYRIYNRRRKVKLEAPAAVGEMRFSGWEVMPSRNSDKPEIEVTLDENSLVFYRYDSAEQTTQIAKRLTPARKNALLASAKTAPEKEAILLLLNSAPPRASTQASKLAAPSAARPIRVGPGVKHVVIGQVLQGETPTVLQAATRSGGWSKVLHRGMVGYLQM